MGGVRPVLEETQIKVKCLSGQFPLVREATVVAFVSLLSIVTVVTVVTGIVLTVVAAVSLVISVPEVAGQKSRGFP